MWKYIRSKQDLDEVCRCDMSQRLDGDGEHIKHFLNPKFNRSSELIVCCFMSNNLQTTSNCIHVLGMKQLNVQSHAATC